MKTCSKCGKSYQVKHPCKAGRCIECKRHFKSIEDHTCPVERVRSISPEAVWKTLKRQACDGCRSLHFSERQLHNYKGSSLCSDCYNIPEIERERSSMLVELVMHDIQKGKTACNICAKPLIDPQTASEPAVVKRVSIDNFSDGITVWALLANGSDIDTIRAASNSCRNLCIRCHDAVSIAKRLVGIQHLKTLEITDTVKRMVESKVARLVHMMVFPTQYES